MSGFEPPTFVLEAIRAAARPTQFERLCADMGIYPEAEPVNGRCPACGKSVLFALRSEPPQWACIDVDCVHGSGHPLPRGNR